jgi:hypothetical protein
MAIDATTFAAAWAEQENIKPEAKEKYFNSACQGFVFVIEIDW